MCAVGEVPRGHCGQWTWQNSETKEVAQAFCGAMSCPNPRCKKAFWQKRVDLISDLINEYDLKKFFTLTLDRAIIPKEVSPWEYIHIPWCSFRRVIKRKYPTFKFVAVLEGHKDKHFPHIHGFTNVWMSHVEWSRHWEGCKGGKVVWVERVVDEKASAYVGKALDAAHYVGKQQLIEAYKYRGNRRIFWRSTGMKSRAECCDASSPWKLIFRKWVDKWWIT